MRSSRSLAVRVSERGSAPIFRLNSASDEALVCEREARVRLRVAKMLLRAGARTAALPTTAIDDPYIRRVLEAGGFRA